jgi:hypothetical protein
MRELQRGFPNIDVPRFQRFAMHRVRGGQRSGVGQQPGKNAFSRTHMNDHAESPWKISRKLGNEFKQCLNTTS